MNLWTVTDDKGNVHTVTFNMDLHNPMISEGWYDLRSFDDFRLHKLCFLKHVGNSSFQIRFYKSCADSTVDRYLEDIRSNDPLTGSKLIHFEFRLPKHNYKASHLVSYFFYSIITHNLNFLLIFFFTFIQSFHLICIYCLFHCL